MMPVRRCKEYDRIKAETVVEFTPSEVKDIVQEMTSRFITPTGRAEGWELLPDQALLLLHLQHVGGALGLIDVGGGKTLLSFLVAAVMGAQRPVLLVPGKLKRNKTPKELAQLRRLFTFPEPIVVSYEELSHPRHDRLLESIGPDMVIMDEVFKVKNAKSATARRLDRFFADHKQPRVALGASALSRHLNQLAHVARWIRGTAAPFPVSYVSLDNWHRAISEKIPYAQRLDPGDLCNLFPVDSAELQALVDKAPEGVDASTVKARLAFRNRLITYPGVVVSKGEGRPSASLYIEGLYPDVSAMRPHFTRLRDEQSAVDDWLVEDPMQRWAIGRQLAMGLEYVWDPRPPKPWQMARAAWASFVRENICVDYVSPHLVTMAVRNGELPEGEPLLARWAELEPTFSPNPTPVWLDDTMLHWVAAWMKKRENKNALVWVEHKEFGRKLAHHTGVKYFGAGGMCGDLPIEDHTGPAILSVAANSEGRNLQAWSRMLLVCLPPTGEAVEQTIGRCHRRGQQADEVYVGVVIACKEQADGWLQMLRDAAFTHQTTGMDQKLLYADVDVAIPHGLP